MVIFAILILPTREHEMSFLFLFFLAGSGVDKGYHSFPATQNQNNHTETILLQHQLAYQLILLFGQLLYLKLTHPYYFVFYHKARGLPARFYLVTFIFLLWQLHGFSLTLPFFLPALSLVFPPSSILLSHWPKHVYSLTNKSNTYTEGLPTPIIVCISDNTI